MEAERMTLKKGCALAVAAYFMLAFAFYMVAGDELKHKRTVTEMVIPSAPVGELLKGSVLEQRFKMRDDVLTSISLKMATYARNNTGSLIISVNDADKQLYKNQVNVSRIKDNSNYDIEFDNPIRGLQGRSLTLKIESEDGTVGNAVTVWYGNSVQAGKALIPRQIDEEFKAVINGKKLDGMLCFQTVSITNIWVGKYYWYMAAALGVLLMLYCLNLIDKQKKGKKSLGLNVISAFKRYNFLMYQLIARDFKTKYKRSVLGVLWSFLNPLLTMLVQYLVFSTLFKTGVSNFPVYLLTGIVCFNFFSEASGMSLMSIVGNVSLISKVYVPKYIYPISRVLSSSINLLLSMIPLFIVLLITKTPITPAALLLPFGIVCLVAFCIGMGFILSSSMVFFRDTQFLWGVLSMLWMYLTPIFYPESIIPARFMLFYKMNPLYHIIRFIRIILINGVSPEPKAYLFCLIASLVPLLAGAVIFKKTQDKFVLNI